MNSISKSTKRYTEDGPPLKQARIQVHEDVVTDPVVATREVEDDDDSINDIKCNIGHNDSVSILSCPSAGDWDSDDDTITEEETDDSPVNQHDVIVVIGEEEFDECTNSLCRWSGYVNHALAHVPQGTKPVLQFPTKDPDEWQVIRHLKFPFTHTQVHKANYQMLYPWFRDLQSASGLQACDQVVVKMVDNASIHDDDKAAASCQELVVALETCISYQRHHAKMEVVECLAAMWLDEWDYGPLVRRLIQCLLQDPTLQKTPLWSRVQKYLPQFMNNNNNNVSPMLVASLMTLPMMDEFIAIKGQKEQSHKALIMVGDLLNAFETTQQVKEFLQKFDFLREYIIPNSDDNDN
jgi:hypothetical protein